MDLKWEKNAWEKGKKIVVGVDESGRGPLAGPVTACAVLVEPDSRVRDELPAFLRGVDDSKKLSAKKREAFYKALTDHPRILWELSWVTPSLIDRINILEATRRAMSRSVKRLERKAGRRIHLVLVDGRISLDMDREQKGVERGDQRIFSCAAASIIAKVFRDRTMQRYHRLFPRYRFDKHKGYGTKLHRERLYRYGPCRIHRRTFSPVNTLDL